MRTLHRKWPDLTLIAAIPEVVDEH